MKIQENKAITLIALVITIIVLIILAGVAINLAFGQNGLVARAKAARGEYSTAEAKEKLEQEILNVQIQAIQEGKEFNLKYLKEKIDKTKYEITLDDEENPTTAVIKEIGSNYYLTVDSKLKVTKVEEKAPKLQYIKFSELTWTSGKASVELSTKEAGTIEYKVGKDGIYQAGTTISNLSNGDIVYARINNNGTYTDEETLEIKDTIAPEEFTITASDITYEGVKLTGSTQDLQTGIKDYTYVAATQTNEIVKEIVNQTATEYTITGLDAETEYVVYMLAYDNAGNVRRSKEEIITTKAEPKNERYGKKVNYSANGINEWQLLYEEDDKNNANYGYTYIITKEYLDITSAEIKEIVTKAGMSTNGKYRAYWDKVPEYTDIADGTNNTINVKEMFMLGYQDLEKSDNLNCISKLLDINIWNTFADGIIDSTNNIKIRESYAIGSPTIELFYNSLKDSYPNLKGLDITTIKYTSKGCWNSIYNKKYKEFQDLEIVQKNAINNTLYYPHKAKYQNCYGYWLSSPGIGLDMINTGIYEEKQKMSYVLCSNGNILANSYKSEKRQALRPVVRISNEYKLQWNSEHNEYDIIEK